jgi:ribosome-associated protein
MAKRKKEENDEQLCKAMVHGMQEKKASHIVKMDMRNTKGAPTDFFIICHADNDKQVEAIADSVEEEVHKQCGEWPWHREGQENREWVLLDYSNVVAHVFLKDKREFYGLEELWGDAEQTVYED